MGLVRERFFARGAQNDKGKCIAWNDKERGTAWTEGQRGMPQNENEKARQTDFGVSYWG